MQSRSLINRWSATAASAVVAIGACVLALNRGFYEQIAGNIFFALTLAGCTIIFLSVRPLREFPQVVAAAVVLVGLQLAVLRVPLRALPAGALLGLSSLLLLVVRRVGSSGQQRQLLHDALVPPLLFLLLGYFGSGPLALTFRLHPKTLDLFLYSFDQSLGVQLSFKVGQVVLSSRLLTDTMLGVYYLLPLVIMFTYARLLVRDRTLAMMAFLAFVIAGPVGVVFYNLVPGCGPGCLMGGKYPFEMISTQQLRQMPLQPLTEGGARNAFPSLHLGWALLALWYSECLSRQARVAMAIFFVGTVFATLGIGEHYFVDLAAAFPFALMIYAGCALNVPISNPRRMVAFVAGLAMMAGWVVLLRWGLPVMWINLAIPWLLVAGTILWTLFLLARLQPLLFDRVADRGMGES
ncbi:MAG: phosphatase PAP2 family protein [Candidatus Sulfotelmatobacter sp.]